MPLRLALLGTGRWGSIITKTIATLPDVELAYVATHEWRELLSKDDIDGVLIATPPSSHTEIALAFIEKKIPVFIEKPMTLSSNDADALVAASKEYGTPVMVGHVHLYNAAYQALKAALPSLGAIQHIEGTESHDGPKRPDYSTLWDSTPHDLSMMIDLVGMPLTVTASAETITNPGTKLYDRARMTLSFPQGVTGSISSDWIGPTKVRNLIVTGEHGTIVYDDVLPEKKVVVTLADGTISYPDYDAERPLTRELNAFIDLLRNGTKPLSSAEDGRAVIRILDAAERSIDEQRAIELTTS